MYIVFYSEVILSFINKDLLLLLPSLSNRKFEISFNNNINHSWAHIVLYNRHKGSRGALSTLLLLSAATHATNNYLTFFASRTHFKDCWVDRGSKSPVQRTKRRSQGKIRSANLWDRCLTAELHLLKYHKRDKKTKRWERTKKKLLTQMFVL